MFFNNFSKEHLLAAHRGFRALYPENTLLSIKKSINKCDFIEFDIQFTKDSIPILFHDDTLKRTTNASSLKNFQKPYNVWDYTYNELKLLDISSWFYKEDPFYQKERLKKVKKIERIQTLENVLEVVKKKNLFINIEIKYNQLHILNKKHFQSVVDLISKYNLEKNVLISSFEHSYVLLFKKLNPKLSTAALAHEKYPKDLISYLKELRVDAYHINQKLATKKLVKELIENGFIVNVYTINDKQKQKKLFSYGVKAIFTDFL